MKVDRWRIVATCEFVKLWSEPFPKKLWRKIVYSHPFIVYPHPRRLLLSCYRNWYMGNIFVYYSFVFVHYNQVQNIFYLINHLYFEFKVLFNIFSECFDFFWYIFSGVHSIDNNWNWILLMLSLKLISHKYKVFFPNIPSQIKT